MSMINNSKTLKLLWEICSIPDYSKDLDEFHSRFLKKIFFVSSQRKKYSRSLDKNATKSN